MDAYMITLSGQGDTQILLVDKSMWDWVMSPDPNVIDPDVLKRVQEFGNMSDCNNGLPYITAGTAQNDAALQCATIVINGVDACFFKLGKAMAFIKEHNINIIDEWSGYIY